MAEAVIPLTERDEVQRLAQTIVMGQHGRSSTCRTYWPNGSNRLVAGQPVHCAVEKSGMAPSAFLPRVDGGGQTHPCVYANETQGFRLKTS